VHNLKFMNASVHLGYCRQTNKFRAHEIKWFHSKWQKSEYYVSMLIRRFVSLWVAYVKVYHAIDRRSSVMRLYIGNEKWYKPKDQYANVMFLLLYTFSLNFLIILNLKTADLHWTLC